MKTQKTQQVRTEAQIAADLQKRMFEQCRGDIYHRCDGPMTPLVAIHRATRLASEGYFTAQMIGDVLEEVLTEYGWLADI